MNIFDFREQLIHDYAEYVRSFLHIRHPRIGDKAVEVQLVGIVKQ